MPNFICQNCGTQYAETDKPPAKCGICTEEREFVAWSGQKWTTLDDLKQSHRNVVRLEELGLYGIGMEPSFGIGQRALLVSRPGGNILWDCISLIDDGLVEMIKGIGGISAIAISHPHGPKPSIVQSFSMPPTKSGSCGPIHKSNFGRAKQKKLAT